jgi:hypothetical protein
VAVEGPLPGQRFIEHHAKREQIAARIELAALDVLGRHVRDLALDDAGGRAPAAAGGAGDAEVGELDLTCGADQHVGGRYVAVHDAGPTGRVAVCMFERGRHVGGQQRDALGVQQDALLGVVAEQPAQVEPVDQLEREVVALIRDAEVQHLHDVAVPQRGGEARLGQKAFHELQVGLERRQDALDAHVLREAARPATYRHEGLGHAAGAKPAHGLKGTKRRR